MNRILEANILMLFCWLPLACWLTTALLGVFESVASGDINKLIGYTTIGGLYSAIYAFLAYLILLVVFLIWDYMLLEASETGLAPYMSIQTIVVCVILIVVAAWNNEPSDPLFSLAIASVFAFAAAQYQKYKYLKRYFGKP